MPGPTGNPRFRPTAPETAQPPSRAPSIQLSARLAFAAGVLCLLGLLATCLAVKLLPSVQLRDAVVLRGFTRLATPRAEPWENTIAEIVDTGPALVLGALLLAAAAARRRAGLIALVVLVPVLASISTETTKALLAMPHDFAVSVPHPPAVHSWPSGHSTAIMALVLCAVVVSPRRFRPMAAALGALLALAVSFSLLALEWHYPSDVVGGYLMAGMWTAFGIAALRVVESRWPARSSPGATPERSELTSPTHTGARGARTPHSSAWRVTRANAALSPARPAVSLRGAACTLLLAALAALAVVIAVAGAHGALSFAASHRLMIGYSAAVAALAIALSSSLALALRR